MHEAAIATAIIDEALAAAAQHNAVRICQIEVEVGVMQQVVPEALHLAFEVASQKSPAEGAELILTMEKTVARCHACDCRFEPDIEHLSFLCPKCRKANVKIIAGNHITLKSLVCDQPNESLEADAK